MEGMTDNNTVKPGLLESPLRNRQGEDRCPIEQKWPLGAKVQVPRQTNSGGTQMAKGI